MSDEVRLSLEEFRNQLQPQRIRALQIIYIALAAAASVFFLIVLAIYLTASQAADLEDSDVDFMKILTLVHIGMACMEYLLGFIMYQLIVRKKKIGNSIAPLSQEGIEIQPETRCLGLIATGTIIRIATLEGAALFGLVICLIGSMNGILQEYPVYWVNLFSFGILILYILVTFPTRQKLEDIFQRRFGDPDLYQAV